MTFEICKPYWASKLRFYDYNYDEEDEEDEQGEYRVPHGSWDFDDKNNTLTMNIEVPGLKKENISLKATEKTLILDTKENSNPKYHRIFKFGYSIDQKDIKAKLEDGILSLKVKKIIPEGQQPVDISIE